jgi:hypothetical protein
VQDIDKDDRLAARREVLLRARCRKSSWHVVPVELGDISQGGCSIVGSADTFAPGEKVRLTIAHLKPIEAQVRWVREDKVGVEFLVALKQRLIGELGELYGMALARKPVGDEG